MTTNIRLIIERWQPDGSFTFVHSCLLPEKTPKINLMNFLRGYLKIQSFSDQSSEVSENFEPNLELTLNLLAVKILRLAETKIPFKCFDVNVKGRAYQFTLISITSRKII